MKLLLPILGLVLWLLFVKGCVIDPAKATCCELVEASDPGVIIGTTSKKNSGWSPLLFKWGSCEPVTNDQFFKLRDSIVSGMNPDQALEILGEYCNKEINKECVGENLGLARANKTGLLFRDLLSTENIRYASRLSAEKCDDLRNVLFRGVKFKYLTNSIAIKENDDKTLVYFATGSDTKVRNAQFDSYLKDVAQRVIRSGEKVSLTGHTDNTGSTSNNQKLGLSRANAIRDILLSKGVPADQVTVRSEGETKPLTSNDTEDGRAQNRRVELQIAK